MRWWILIALAGCRNVLGIPDETTVETFPIRIDVTGAIDASDDPIEVYVTDSYNDSERKLVIQEDGAAMFDAGLLNGVDFTLRSTPNCQLSRTNGRVESAPVTATLACDGVLALADFGFSAPFETVKTGTSYRSYGSFLIEQTTVQPVTVYPESVGIASRSGVDIGTAPFTPAPNTDLVVRVQASPTLFTLPDRSYTTTFDLLGLPAQFGYGKPSQAADGGHFGTAIDAYGNYLLVGMPDKGNGQAILYSRKGRVWKEELVVDGTTGSRLGAAVAVGENLFVVGAPGIDQVLVYTFNTTSQQWTAQTPAVGPQGSEFGFALAIAKVPTPDAFVVGGPATNLVRKYAISGGFSPITILDQPGDRFGAAVAIADNGRVMVGAPGDDTTFSDSGAAYVYTTPSNTTYVKLKASTPGAGDAFGSAVAISSDEQLFAVGAPLEDSGSTTDETDNSKPGAGAVYLFKSPGTTSVYIKAANVDTGDGFGSALAFRRKITAASYMLAVGAPYEDSGATGVDKQSDETAPDSGAVYLLTTTPLPLGAAQTAMFKASNTGEGDQFGAAVAITNDSMLVGAPYEDSGATGWNASQGDGAIDGDGGAVYTFR